MAITASLRGAGWNFGIATAFEFRLQPFGPDLHRGVLDLTEVCRFANALKGLGVARGDRVAILMLNGHRYLELYYAVPWVGALVMPLNIRLSPLEILAQITETRRRVTLFRGVYPIKVNQHRYVVEEMLGVARRVQALP